MKAASPEGKRGRLTRISHTDGAVIVMKRVDPSLKGSKSVAEATLEVLSEMGGRCMATISGGRQEPDRQGNLRGAMPKHRASGVPQAIGLLTAVPTPLV
jgi:hypothetical protein